MRPSKLRSNLQCEDDLDGIDLLRALLPELPKLGSVGCVAAKRIAFYCQEAPKGRLTLDCVFGLSLGRGGEPWWEKDDRIRGYDTLRLLADLLKPEGNDAAKVETLMSELLSYETTRWKRDSFLQQLPNNYKNTKYEYLWLAFKQLRGKGSLKRARLYQILKGSNGTRAIQ